MEQFIKSYFNQIKIGEGESFEGFQVFPLFSEKEYKVEYLMMKEALQKGVLKIEEVSESGSVPELSATNKSDLPILLLGGEELEGAKQNRILNMSILLPPNKKTVIPVSCVEQGRWSYRGRNFKETDNIAFKRMREKNYEDLYKNESKEVEQHRVWEEVRMKKVEMEVDEPIPTDAMKDILEAKSKEFSDYYDNFKLHEGQVGILAVSKGMVLGFDIIGRSDKFYVVFKKFLKSYIAEDMTRRKKDYNLLTEKEVRGFFDKAIKAKEKRIEGVGLGYDYRYNSEDVVGSVLSYKKEIIHSVFLSKEDNSGSRKVDDEDEFFRDFRDRRNNFDF